jgi:predicted naringenin-chalcone synthase
VAELGLRPEVSRIALTTSACAGGVQALARAADLVRARPGATVLVVVSEVLSAIYHRDEDSVESMIYKALFGDSAGACLVTSEPLGPGFAIESTFEFVLPHSLDRYWGQMDATGLHFYSTKKALTAPRDALPHVLHWLGNWRPSFGVIHPGGPRIITDTAAAVGVDPRHSLTSLSENGNLGGNAVLDVLRRTHTAAPAAGERGLLLAFGPGFTVAAARGTWH